MMEEGKKSSTAARAISLAIKKKIINKGREVQSAGTLEEKVDLLSQQVSALAALTLVGISVSGDGLLSKAGIVSGLFTERFEKDFLTKNETEDLSDRTSTKDVGSDLTPFMKDCLTALSQQR